MTVRCLPSQVDGKPEQDAGGWLNNAIKEEKSIRRLVEEGAKQKRRAVPTLGAARHECM